MRDDFYRELSEFDEMVEDFKESLRSSVKEEINSEMDNLRKENAALREIRDNWHAKVRELEQEYIKKKDELRRKVQEAEQAARDAKRLRLAELLAGQSVFAYTIKAEYIKQQKCDLCDNYRQRKYITPLGREAKEDCLCKKSKVRYHIKKVPIVSISQDSNGRVSSAYLVNDDAEASFLRNADTFFDETPFEEVNRYHPLFHDENRARRYVAWLNKKEGAS